MFQIILMIFELVVLLTMIMWMGLSHDSPEKYLTIILFFLGVVLFVGCIGLIASFWKGSENDSYW